MGRTMDGRTDVGNHRTSGIWRDSNEFGTLLPRHTWPSYVLNGHVKFEIKNITFCLCYCYTSITNTNKLLYGH